VVGVVDGKTDVKDDNLLAALAYLLTIITGLVIFLMYREKKNKFVIFHSLQAIMFGSIMMCWMIIGFVLGILIGLIPVAGILINLLGFLLWLGVLFFGTIFLMYQAYSGKTFKIPFIGDLAEKHAG
jgi:uncharacterized membrane protein